MRKKWGNRIGAIVLACALTMNGLPVQSISASTQKAYAAAESETGKKKQQAQMILRAGLRKADSLPEFLYMIHLSSKTMTLTTSLAPIWNLRSLQI